MGVVVLGVVEVVVVAVEVVVSVGCVAVAVFNWLKGNGCWELMNPSKAMERQSPYGQPLPR
eukprot:2610206-Amphidinium_carterae.1